MAEAETDMDFADDDLTGQCMAVTRNGKRCPNMAEPGSRYCSMHADYVPSAEEAAAQEAADEAAAVEPDEAEGAARSDG